MSINAVIGSNGFIGSRIKWYADNFMDTECVGISRDNYDFWAGHEFITLVWAAGSARKDLSDSELMKVNAEAVYKALRDFKFDKFIYISSQAIYAPSQYYPKEEDVDINLPDISAYGRSKHLGEEIVKKYCTNYVVIRPNGFSGPGLKKNVIHSLAKNPPEWYYQMDSHFQIIHTDIFAAVLFKLAFICNREIFNVSLKEVITPVDVAQWMGVDIDSVVTPDNRIPPKVRAVFNTSKLEELLHEEPYFELPTAEEAVRKWNEPFEVRMPSMWETVGIPRSQR